MIAAVRVKVRLEEERKRSIAEQKKEVWRRSGSSA